MRFLIYRADDFTTKSKAVKGFEKYADAKAYAETLDYPAKIIFNWQGAAHAPRRTKDDFEFTTDSGEVILLKWEKVEFRAYKKRTGEDLKLGATVPDALLEYINKNF